MTDDCQTVHRKCLAVWTSWEAGMECDKFVVPVGVALPSLSCFYTRGDYDPTVEEEAMMYVRLHYLSSIVLLQLSSLSC